MATYKVIQDIEAEDKILGPLTLRQFIFALIAVFFLYISFICLTKGATFLLILFLPPAIFTGFFAFPFGKDQPTEVWALAKIRFYFKPRRRIWDQSGVKELVTITVPKKLERILTNGLSQNEVQSRLKALASTIDSRGWAIKNVNVNLYSSPNPMVQTGDSDRLIDMSSLPQEVPNYDVQAADDMLDETNNPIALQFESMISASTKTHRERLIEELKGVQAAAAATLPSQPAPGPATPPNDYWFMNQPQPADGLKPGQDMFSNARVIQPGSDDDSLVPTSADDAALTAQLKAHHVPEQNSYSHLRTIQPLNSQPQPTPNPAQPLAPPTDPALAPTTVTVDHDAAILSLANNNDLNVATLAREAYKVRNPDQSPDDEVVISLR